MGHCHHCGKDCGHDDSEIKLTHAFMHSVLSALSAILNKLDKVLDRLPETIGKPTKMELKFGQPQNKENQ